MNEPVVLEQLEEHIMLIRLNRPEALNALNFSALHLLEAHLDKLADQDIRVLILTGTGKAFCAGGDLKELKTFDAEKARLFSLTGHRVFNKIEQFPCPVIAALNGYTLGGGGELACACDLRYAADTVHLGQPEPRMGMITGWGGSFRLPRLIGVARAKELVFTNRSISADEALLMGLVNGVFPPDRLMEKVLGLARTILKGAPIANRLCKKLFNRYSQDVEAMAHEESLSLSFCVTTEDQHEAIKAFLEKREPVFRNR